MAIGEVAFRLFELDRNLEKSFEDHFFENFLVGEDFPREGVIIVFVE